MADATYKFTAQHITPVSAFKEFRTEIGDWMAALGTTFDAESIGNKIFSFSHFDLVEFLKDPGSNYSIDDLLPGGSLIHQERADHPWYTQFVMDQF